LYTIFWEETLKGRDHVQDLGVDVRIILEWVLWKYGGKVWTGRIWFRMRTSGGLCERGDEQSGSIKGGKFLE
jgi:hypothetical protein